MKDQKINFCINLHFSTFLSSNVRSFVLIYLLFFSETCVIETVFHCHVNINLCVCQCAHAYVQGKRFPKSRGEQLYLETGNRHACTLF